jgi:two-component system heavy metal sensor histidine kinase CusS
VTRPKSITFRLTLFFSTASTVVLLVVGNLIGPLVEKHFEEQDMAELSGKLELIRHILSRVRAPDELDAVPQSLFDALVGHHDLSVAVIGPDRRRLFATPGAVFPDTLLAIQPLKNAPERTRPMVWEQNGQAFRGIAAAAVTGMASQPPARVVIAINIGHHHKFMAAFRKSLWLAIGAGILLTALLGWIAARRGLAPVREMAKVAQGISASRLGDRLLPESVPTELTDLATAFNEMLARLEDSFRRLSDFSSDLAHELRTPISNLMTQTEVAISRARSADEYREVLYSNLEEHERLARMIADMLFLAKADNGLIVPNSGIVDLAMEVRNLFGFYEAFAEEQGVSLNLAGEGIIRGDRLMIRRALSNLLSNAIRHTPSGEAVKVHIEQAKSGVIRLTIENPGEAIEPEHLPRLFDRFYRIDPSRQKSGDGAGLGLAITKSIVEAHKGTIQAFSSNGLTCFGMTFPAA